MTEVSDFINTLFEKSKILNDMNTEFLRDLMLGELTQSQRLELFYKNTKYHENILHSIEQIVKDLDKTSVLISPEQKELLLSFRNLNDLSKKKVLELFHTIQETLFIPKALSTCPFCGDKLLNYSNECKGCKKVPLMVANKIYGYTVDCLKKRDIE